MTLAIKIDHICKTYKTGLKKRTVALTELCLDINEGETFGFIGPNGAGKSTTIKILTGVIQPTSGVASMFGKSITSPMARLGVGYVPENPYLNDYLTPIEVLSTTLGLHKCKVGNKSNHIMHWLEKLEIAHVANKTIRSFSKGMTQRVALAQAMCIEPRMLILDEPLSGLDPIGRRDVVNLLAEYKNKGTLFFTSHVLHDVERLADRFGLIDHGEMRTIKSPSELFSGENQLLVRYTSNNPLLGSIPINSNRWIIETSQEQLWQILDAIKAKDGQLQEVTSTMNLEKAFFKLIKQ